MKTERDMGKVIVKLRLTSQWESANYERGASPRKPRQIGAEALVDTGATRLYLKPSVIKALRLRQVDKVESQTANGIRTHAVYEPVRLEVMGRSGTFDVVDIDERAPNLLGQVPLEVLDFVADPKAQKLIPNPEHGGIQMTEIYWGAFSRDAGNEQRLTLHKT